VFRKSRFLIFYVKTRVFMFFLFLNVFCVYILRFPRLLFQRPHFE